MKKIFTLLLSMGLLTAAFAQDGRHNTTPKPSPYSQTYFQGNHKKSSNDIGKWKGKNGDDRSFQANDKRSADRYGTDDMKVGYGKMAEAKHSSDKRDDARFDSKVRHDDPARNSLLSLVFSFVGRK